jgi:hypothetical protein
MIPFAHENHKIKTEVPEFVATSSSSQMTAVQTNRIKISNINLQRPAQLRPRARPSSFSCEPAVEAAQATGSATPPLRPELLFLLRHSPLKESTFSFPG